MRRWDQRVGGCYIHGRSDSTPNRYGVRIGSVEIYGAVERVDTVAGSLVGRRELPNGGYFMPLFLCLRAGATLGEALKAGLRSACARNAAGATFRIKCTW